MDVWEHAFLLDYKPAERPKYIEAFFSNIDWGIVDGRVQGGTDRICQTVGSIMKEGQKGKNNSIKMVGAWGLEPQTSAVSRQRSAN
jgi:hypothetical protein